ncbi:MAG TPA: type II secretion system protein [Candidatus Acidoferrum sp.]|jgi:prepilin-type N-terminal cleavage/methylation domain-containing protein|nr:type II secretion system protein [Candidatus Acidoferrum sp.]
MKTRRQSGFTMLELMLTLTILSIVLAVVIDGISMMQKRNAVEVSKVDLTQSAREFMDQIVNDIHQAGYPSFIMFDTASFTAPQSSTDCTVDSNVACGLVSLTSSDLQFEGDVDGTGVSEVFIELRPIGGPCPCTIRRGTEAKSAYMLGNLPAFYTQVDNVMNTTVFTASLTDGTPVTLPANHGLGNLGNITAIGITLYVKSADPDLQTGLYPMVTMVASAKISNVQKY